MRTIIDAVNAKDADKYVSVFAEDAIVQLYGGSVRVRGREELRKNRAQHFRRFPETRSAIQHLVEIGPFVIMHDRLWLRGNESPSDIVEVFTFENDLIVKVEVIQPAGFALRRTTTRSLMAEGVSVSGSGSCELAVLCIRRFEERSPTRGVL